MTKGGYTYILSNKNITVIYIGVTASLKNRAYEHKNGMGSAFASKYKCSDLLYYEFYDTIEEAIDREKQLKGWNREWKFDLIKKRNPDLKDLYEESEDYD